MADPSSDSHPLAAALLLGGAADVSTRVNSRAALIDAAIGEFAAKGYEATTVAGIAKRAGVTTGALYAHFQGKLDLLLAAIGLRPIDDVERSAGELAELPRATAVSWLRHALLATPDDRMVLLLDVIVVARRDPRIARALRSGLEAYVAATTRVIEAAETAGGVSPMVEAAEMARLLSLLSLGRTVFAALGAPPPSEAAFSRIGDAALWPSAGGGGHDAQDEAEGKRDGDGDGGSMLAAVRVRAGAVRHAERALHDAIVDAVAAGHSLRQVGAAAGLSHEGIRRILRGRGPAASAGPARDR